MSTDTPLTAEEESADAVCLLRERLHFNPPPCSQRRSRHEPPDHNHPEDSLCLFRFCPKGAWDAALASPSLDAETALEREDDWPHPDAAALASPSLDERAERLTAEEHEDWRDLSDRDLLSYAWSILASAERALPHGSVQRAEVATAVGHLGRRIGDHPADAALASPSLDVERLDKFKRRAEACSAMPALFAYQELVTDLLAALASGESPGESRWPDREERRDE